MMAAKSRSSARQLLNQVLTVLGPDAELDHAQEREWASATFEGARHRFTFTVVAEGPGGEHVARQALRLAEYEFTVPGELVADCHVTLGGVLSASADGLARRRMVTVELLTINAD